MAGFQLSTEVFDDRVAWMLRKIWPSQQADIRDLIIQPESTDAVHDSPVRPTPTQIEAGYRIDETLTTPEPTFIAIVDDVLTTGAHFQAARTILVARFPAIQIVGLFVARRVPETDPAL